MEDDLVRFYAEDPKFKVRVASQSSNRATDLERALRQKFPHLCIKKVIGRDGGQTKKDHLEDVNKTLEEASVFIHSPVIESGVDITIETKKLYGILCSKSNGQLALLQMIARSRNVKEERMDSLCDPSLKLNDNYKFWTFGEVLELNKDAVQARGVDEHSIVDGELVVGESEKSKRRNMVSVFNTVETLNKHPSIYLNYMRVLLEGKGVKWQVEKSSGDGKRTKEERTNWKIKSILEAQDVDQETHEDLSKRQKIGKTTTEENHRFETEFWKRYLAKKELDEKTLKGFVFGSNPLTNFLSLIDLRNHEKEDIIRSSKHLEKVSLITKLLYGLGFDSPLDGKQIDPESLMTNWACDILDDPDCKRHKRITSSLS